MKKKCDDAEFMNSLFGGDFIDHSLSGLIFGREYNFSDRTQLCREMMRSLWMRRLVQQTHRGNVHAARRLADAMLDRMVAATPQTSITAGPIASGGEGGMWSSGARARGDSDDQSTDATTEGCGGDVELTNSGQCRELRYTNGGSLCGDNSSAAVDRWYPLLDLNGNITIPALLYVAAAQTADVPTMLALSWKLFFGIGTHCCSVLLCLFLY